MKKIKMIGHIAMIIFAILISYNTYAQSNNRTVLKDKLRFFYIAKPNKTTEKPVLLNNKEIYNGTESGAFWKNNNMRRAQALVKALLADDKNGGDKELQDFSTKIIKVLNKAVAVYLYDDVNITVTQKAANKWGLCLDNPGKANAKAWPCAANQSTSDDYSQNWAKCKKATVPARTDDKWAGYMHLGAHHLNTNKLSWTKGTFIHELVHTQDVADMRLHLFWVNGANYRYGLDGAHYSTEAVPDQAMTYSEGIANVITLLYEGNEAKKYFDWFSKNGDLWVEINPNPTTAGVGNLDSCTVATTPSPKAWLYKLITDAGNTPRKKDKSKKYAAFGVRDLQPKFIAHNEFILAMILSEYARHVSLKKFMEALTMSNNKLFRVSASGIAILFENMCKVGLPTGKTLADVSQSSSTPTEKKYLLPLAYADYFTAYKSKTKADFKAIFENALPDGWIDLYWNNGRKSVRSAAPITNNKPKQSDLTSIAVALGINKSTPDNG